MSNAGNVSMTFKKATGVIGCVLMLALALVVCGCSHVAKATSTEAAPDPMPAKLDVLVTADGYEAGKSSPVFVEVVDGDNSAVYHAIDAGEPQSLEISVAGEYSISFLSPINADGSIYAAVNTFEVAVADDGSVSVSDTTDYTTASEPKAADGEKTSEDYAKGIEVVFEQIEASKVTEEQLAQLQADIAKAIANGDEDIQQSKDAIKATVEVNAKCTADAIAKAAEEKAAIENVPAAAETVADNSSDSGYSDNGYGNGSYSDGTSSDSSYSGGGSSDSGYYEEPSSGGGIESQLHPSGSEAHVHDWVPIEETTSYSTVVCNACGAEFGSADAFYAHSKERLNAGDDSHGSYSAIEHYDTVVVGYRCSTCGA